LAQDRVRKPQHEQVLRRLFAEVVINAVNLPLIECFVDRFIEPLRRSQVVPNGFSMITPACSCAPPPDRSGPNARPLVHKTAAVAG
jgi:hypothetical protein